jgi:hypothetical protein
LRFESLDFNAASEGSTAQFDYPGADNSQEELYQIVSDSAISCTFPKFVEMASIIDLMRMSKT